MPLMKERTLRPVMSFDRLAELPEARVLEDHAGIPQGRPQPD
jgi:hypothetical protein